MLALLLFTIFLISPARAETPQTILSTPDEIAQEIASLENSDTNTHQKRTCGGQPTEIYQDDNNQITVAVLNPSGTNQANPSTITTSGQYCLTENLTIGSYNRGIIINANDVVLDLNGYSIKGVGNTKQNAITINSNLGNIIIKNGTIEKMGLNGILVNGGSTGISIQNMQLLLNGSYGILMQGTQSCMISQCIASSNFNSGIVIAESASLLNQNIFIDKCVAIGNGIHGFELISCSRLNVTNSLSFSNKASGFREANGNSVDFVGCESHNNTNNGFISSGNNQSFNQCIANTNGLNVANTAGFLISGNRHNLENCQAQSNIVGFQLTGNSHTLLNCLAQNNTTGILLTTISNQCQVRNNTTIANTTGLQNNAILPSVNRIYGNFSSDNTTNFVGVPAANISTSPVAATAINFTANIAN